jgi:hypothetical protein
VDKIFDHPLRAILNPAVVRGESALVPVGGNDWPYDVEYHVTPFIIIIIIICSDFEYISFLELHRHVRTLARQLQLPHAPFQIHSFPRQRSNSRYPRASSLLVS